MIARPAVLLLHRWAGLILGVLVAVICLSGAIAVFRPEIDRLACRPASGAPRAADLDAVAAGLQAGSPGTRVASLVLAGIACEADAWMLRGEREGAWTVFTDPATGEELGRTRGSWSSATAAWIARFHHDLWLPPAGGVVVGVGGLALVVFCLSGLYLCWPGLFRRRPDLHRTAGLAALPVLLFVAITGAMFEFTWLRRAAHVVLGGTAADAPMVLRSQAQRPQSAAAAGPDIGWAAGFAAAAAAVPDGQVARLFPPRRNDANGTWRATVDVPGNLSPNGGAIVHLDRRTAAVIEVQDPRRMSAGGWLLNQHLGLHTGAWGGPLTRLLWVAAGLAPLILLLTGWRMWRRNAQRSTATRNKDVP